MMGPRSSNREFATPIELSATLIPDKDDKIRVDKREYIIEVRVIEYGVEYCDDPMDSHFSIGAMPKCDHEGLWLKRREPIKILHSFRLQGAGAEKWLFKERSKVVRFSMALSMCMRKFPEAFMSWVRVMTPLAQRKGTKGEG